MGLGDHEAARKPRAGRALLWLRMPQATIEYEGQ